MAYLIPNDYKVNIQDANIQQIINADESIRDRAQLAGEAEAQSYLKQKYDISKEFKNILPWSPSAVYKSYDRFYLYSSITWIGSISWVVNDIVVYQGKVYICIQNVNSGVSPDNNPTSWALCGTIYQIFTPKLPYPEFSYTAMYNINDYVIWKDKIYKCRVQTPVLDHDTALQYRNIENLPYPNVAPDDLQNGLDYWAFQSNFSVTTVRPTNAAYISYDPRDPQLVLYTCDIVLYHLHACIAPRNIPDLRVKRYDDAKEWLKMCAEGAITPNLPLIAPKQGNRIRYGGGIRQINTY